jgi:hypothetical protein
MIAISGGGWLTRNDVTVLLCFFLSPALLLTHPLLALAVKICQNLSKFVKICQNLKMSNSSFMCAWTWIFI